MLVAYIQYCGLFVVLLYAVSERPTVAWDRLYVCFGACPTRYTISVTTEHCVSTYEIL